MIPQPVQLPQSLFCLNISEKKEMTMIQVFAGPFIRCRIWGAGTRIWYRGLGKPTLKPQFPPPPSRWRWGGARWRVDDGRAAASVGRTGRISTHARSRLSAPSPSLCVAEDSPTVGVGEPLRAEVVTPQKLKLGREIFIMKGRRETLWDGFWKNQRQKSGHIGWVDGQWSETPHTGHQGPSHGPSHACYQPWHRHHQWNLE